MNSTTPTSPANSDQHASYNSADSEPPAPVDPLTIFTPVLLVAPRRNSLTADRQRKFIVALAATGVVNQAARAIGCSPEALYQLRQRAGAEEFCIAWECAVDQAMQRLEDSALARAMNGEERMVVSGGKVIGTETRYNDRLVMFLLRTRRSDRFGKHVGPGDPQYERIREEIMAEERARRSNEPSSIDALLAKWELMKTRKEACRLMLAADANREDCDEVDEEHADYDGLPIEQPGQSR